MMSDSILPDDVLAAVLVDGLVNATNIGRAIEGSAWFYSVDEPAWRTVWYSSDRSDEQVQAAVDEMMRQFDAREFEATGEILHVFGLVLKLASLKAIDWTMDQAVIECRAYADDLRNQGRLEPPKIAILDDVRHGSYAGLGFAGREHPQFSELWAYLDEQRANAERDRFGDHARSLLETMKTDPQAFVRQISSVHDSTVAFYRLPVLATLPAEEFAVAVSELLPSDLREVMLGLSGRYDLGLLETDLREEKSWLLEVRETLIKIAAKSPIWTKERLAEAVRHTIDERLGIRPSDTTPEED